MTNKKPTEASIRKQLTKCLKEYKFLHKSGPGYWDGIALGRAYELWMRLREYDPKLKNWNLTQFADYMNKTAL